MTFDDLNKKIFTCCFVEKFIVWRKTCKREIKPVFFFLKHVNEPKTKTGVTKVKVPWKQRHLES